MRPTPFRRSYLGIAGLTIVALIVSVLASTSAPQSVSAAPAAEPRFWEWGEEPFSDDLNHYLVTVEAIAGNGWLRWMTQLWSLPRHRRMMSPRATSTM